MFNVDISRLKTPAANRGISITKNDDGTASVNGLTFDRARDLEDYLITIPRTDIPN